MPDMKSVILTVAMATVIVFLLLGLAHAGEANNDASPELPQGAAYVPAGEPVLNIPTSKTKSALSEWYGWQNLAIEAGAITVFALGAKEDLNVPMYLGLGGMLLGPPIVHWAHGNVGKGFISLGVMVALPAGAGFLGSTIGGAGEHCESGDDMCGFGAGFGTYIGAIIGAIGAIVVDSALAVDEPKEKDQPPPQAKGPKFEITPTVFFSQERAGFGVVGMF